MHFTDRLEESVGSIICVLCCVLVQTLIIFAPAIALLLKYTVQQLSQNPWVSLLK